MTQYSDDSLDNMSGEAWTRAIKEIERERREMVPERPDDGQPAISDEELLWALFKTPDYGPELQRVSHDQGWRIGLIIQQARQELGDLITGDDAREILGIPEPKAVSIEEIEKTFAETLTFSI